MAAKNTKAEKADGVKEKKAAEPVKNWPNLMKYALIAIGIIAVIAVIIIIATTPGDKPKPPVNDTNGTVQMNAFQYCAKGFNEGAIIKSLVNDYYEGTGSKTYILTMPKVISCDGTNYTYSFELGDGFAKTRINGNFVKSTFKTGIVAKGISVSEAETSQGIYVYLSRISPGVLSYSYGLIENSIFNYDKYATQVVLEKYAITKVKALPAVIFNCKQAYVGVMIDDPIKNNFLPDAEKLMLETLSCIFNEGVPEGICSELGIIPQIGPDGKKVITNATLPQAFALKSYITSADSCKPDNETTTVEVFYTPDCKECSEQRPILEAVGREFGDSLDITYYCVGDKEECLKFIEPANA